MTLINIRAHKTNQNQLSVFFSQTTAVLLKAPLLFTGNQESKSAKRSKAVFGIDRLPAVTAFGITSWHYVVFFPGNSGDFSER